MNAWKNKRRQGPSAAADNRAHWCVSVSGKTQTISREVSCMSGKYMAYVGSYSYTGKAKGITVFDVDVENGMFKERCEIEVDNSSYVIASSDGKTLYSIADEGVVSFRILPNGSLARLNSAPIRGMRGCHLCTDEEDKYVFVSRLSRWKDYGIKSEPGRFCRKDRRRCI